VFMWLLGVGALMRCVWFMGVCVFLVAFCFVSVFVGVVVWLGFVVVLGLLGGGCGGVLCLASACLVGFVLSSCVLVVVGGWGLSVGVMGYGFVLWWLTFLGGSGWLGWGGGLGGGVGGMYELRCLTGGRRYWGGLCGGGWLRRFVLILRGVWLGRGVGCGWVRGG